MKSVLLFGPRGTGKSTLIQSTIKDRAPMIIDLLKTDTFSTYLKNPALLRQQIESQVHKTSPLYVLIDEIQKVPSLLNEVHYLIEKYPKKICFLMSGSSARKLKKQGANLLAGRAISLRLYPFSSSELGDTFELHNTLQWGQLPMVHASSLDEKALVLKTYVDTYLREEILQEALVRNLESFSLFLDLAAQNNGDTVHFSKLGKQCGVAHVTIKEYYQILQDTLIGQLVFGWTRSVRKQVSKSPKFYLFDIGIINALRGELQTEVKTNSVRVGKLFETFIFNEIVKTIEYRQLSLKIFYWRQSDKYEVDFVLAKTAFSDPIALEVKSASVIHPEDLMGLLEFKKSEPKAKLYCLCQVEHAYQLNGVDILPWRQGLAEILR